MQFGHVLIKKKGVRKVRGVVSALHIPKDGGRRARGLPQRWDKAGLGLQCLSLCDRKRQIWAKSCACPELIDPFSPIMFPYTTVSLWPWDLRAAGSERLRWPVASAAYTTQSEEDSLISVTFQPERSFRNTCSSSGSLSRNSHRSESWGAVS